MTSSSVFALSYAGHSRFLYFITILKGSIMVRSQMRRSNAYVVRKKAVTAYKSGSVCFVLSAQDCMSLVQFYRLLMTIERRMKDSLQSSSDPKSNISLRKTKGSQLREPFLFFLFLALFCIIFIFKTNITELTSILSSPVFAVSYFGLLQATPQKHHDRHYNSFDPTPTF